jgi:hypothetical protein
MSEERYFCLIHPKGHQNSSLATVDEELMYYLIVYASAESIWRPSPVTLASVARKCRFSSRGSRETVALASNCQETVALASFAAAKLSL